MPCWRVDICTPRANLDQQGAFVVSLSSSEDFEAGVTCTGLGGKETYWRPDSRSCRRRSSQMACRSPLNLSVCSCRIRRISSTIGSFRMATAPAVLPGCRSPAVRTGPSVLAPCHSADYGQCRAVDPILPRSLAPEYLFQDYQRCSSYLLRLCVENPEPVAPSWGLASELVLSPIEFQYPLRSLDLHHGA